METKIKITNTTDGRILVQAPNADKFWMAQLLSAGERKFLSRSDKHGGFVVMHGVFQIGADDEKMFIVVKFDYKQRKFVHRVVDGDLNKVNRKCFDLKQEALVVTAYLATKVILTCCGMTVQPMSFCRLPVVASVALDTL
jgi:hypothetical protein